MKKLLFGALALMAIFAVSSCGNCGKKATATTAEAETPAEDVQLVGVQFATSDFAGILAKAKAENKLVFMDVYASWCPPCKKMTNEVFPQEHVGDYFNAEFICCKFDAEVGEGLEIARKYGITNYPTFLFIDGDGKEVGRMLGYVEADEFLANVKKEVSVIKNLAPEAVEAAGIK